MDCNLNIFPDHTFKHSNNISYSVFLILYNVQFLKNCLESYK